MKHFYILFLLFILNNFIIKAQATDYVTNLDEPLAIILNGTDLIYTEYLGDVFKVDITYKNPIPTIITSDITSPFGLALYGTELYIGDNAEGKIFKIDLSNNNPSLIEFVSGIGDINFLVIYQNFLIYSETNTHRISKIDLSVTNPVPITILSGNYGPFGVAIYGNDLYFSAREFFNNNIITISKIDVTDDSASPIRVLDNNSGYSNPLGLRTIGSDLYISDYVLGKIFKADLTEPILSLSEVVSDVYGARDCIANNNTLFIIQHAEDKISRLDDFLDIEEFNLRNQIVISPNPTNNYIQISNLHNTIDFKIVNTMGQSVVQGKIAPKKRINVRDLSNGMYLIILNNGVSKKFIKN